MLTQKSYDMMCKFLIVGSTQVGKTNLLTRFTEDVYTETHITTIGVDFKFKEIEINGKTMKMQIWDTAGQERFRTLTQNYYKGAHGVLLVYAVDDKDSFQDISTWINSLKQHGRTDIQIILVANKVDLIDRKVTSEQGIKLGEQMNFEYFETSAKNGLNVKEVFLRLAEMVEQAQSIKQTIVDEVTNQNVKLNSGNQKNFVKKRKECC